MIGILGGTFDPVHYGHLRLALEVGEVLGLSQVRFIPAGAPWHRDAPLASPAHRLAMVRLACADNPLFVVDGREAERLAPGYTVDTLTELRAEWGEEVPFCLILGADAFLGLPRWHRWQTLFHLAHVVVARRPGVPPLDGHAGMAPALVREYAARSTGEPGPLRAAPAGRIYVQTITALDISATRIRADLAAGRSPRYLLPDSVLDYLRRNGLYDARPHGH